MVFVIIIFLILCALLVLLNIYSTSKQSDYILWGIGVDIPIFYSRKFRIKGNFVTIEGVQEVLNENAPIQYSVVTLSWWGKMVVYGQSEIYKNYKKPNSFKISFTDLPNGENYRIFLYHYENMANGKFKLITD